MKNGWLYLRNYGIYCYLLSEYFSIKQCTDSPIDLDPTFRVRIGFGSLLSDSHFCESDCKNICIQYLL